MCAKLYSCGAAYWHASLSVLLPRCIFPYWHTRCCWAGALCKHKCWRCRSSKRGSKSAASTDLVSAAELQRYYQGLTEIHMEALVAIRAFWREVLSNRASVASLAKVEGHTCVSVCFS